MSRTESAKAYQPDRHGDGRKRWFAVRVKSRCEKAVLAMAQYREGVETYLPTYVSRRRWTDRKKSIEFPIFPGYIFCRLDPSLRLRVLTISGVVHFVGIGDTPVPIDDEEMAALRTAVQSGLSAEPWPFLEIGEVVRITEGPLAGLEGLFVGDARKQRLVVSISLLKRSVAIEIERHWVARARRTVQNKVKIASDPA